MREVLLCVSATRIAATTRGADTDETVPEGASASAAADAGRRAELARVAVGVGRTARQHQHQRPGVTRSAALAAAAAAAAAAVAWRMRRGVGGMTMRGAYGSVWNAFGGCMRESGSAFELCAYYNRT
jgi:hypothetical protein